MLSADIQAPKHVVRFMRNNVFFTLYIYPLLALEHGLKA